MNHKACSRTFALCLTVAALLLAGCASVPEGPAAMKQQALSFTPPPGMAGIYIIRPYNYSGSAMLWKINLDYRDFGSLVTRSYLYNIIPPGEHFVNIENWNLIGMPFRALAGENCYITVKPGWLDPAEFNVVSETDGQALVRKFKLSGDDSYKPLPEKADSVALAACHVVLVQDDPFILATKTHLMDAGGPTAGSGTVQGGGLQAVAGEGVANLFSLVAIDPIVNKYRSEKAAKMSAAFAGHDIGASFRNDFHSSLSNAISSSSWLRTLPLQMTRKNEQVTAAEINQHPIVQINLIYFLSYDLSTLIMQAHLAYFRQGQTKATYTCYYTYFSQPIGPEKGDAAVAKWTSSNEQLLRRRMNEGMKEVIAMLDLDFFHRGPMSLACRWVQISYFDPLALCEAQRKGFMLAKDNGRILFQDEMGMLSVIPDSADVSTDAAPIDATPTEATPDSTHKAIQDLNQKMNDERNKLFPNSNQ